MPTLRSIFMLQDNYSRAKERNYSSTQRATSAIDKTSSAVDTVDSRFAVPKNSSNRLASALTRVGTAFPSLEDMKKAMNISDTYTNIASKLSLITQNAKEFDNVQSKIFAAADRSRGSYADMADTVSNLGMIAGEQFGGNDNIIKFTETMQKMFKIGGTSASEQAGAFLQLQQAIGLGRLQGQNLKTLSEDAPLVEKAIAQYLGKSTSEVKALGTQGKITSEVLINSVLQYSGTADKQIGQMKYTWGDYWNKIKNGAYRAFGGVFGEESRLLASQNFKNMINGIISSFYALANVAKGVMTASSDVGGFISSNWSVIVPIIGGITAALLLYNGALLVNNVIQGISTGVKTIATIAAAAHGLAVSEETLSTLGMTQAQLAFNAALYACPLTWILLIIVAVIAAIYIVIAIINKVTGSTISATGVILGCLNVAWTFIKGIGLSIADFFIGIWDAAKALIANLKVAFPNLWIDIQAGFLGFVNVILSGVQSIINTLNKIPGVNINASELAGAITKNNSTLSNLAKSRGTYEDVDAAFTKGSRTYSTFQSGWASSAYNTGYQAGQGIDSKVKGYLDNAKTLADGASKDNNEGDKNTGLGTMSNPAAIQGTVNIADQDLQYLRDLAEKQYINKFSTAVLSPKLSVNFTGNAGDKDDQRQIYVTMGKMLREELATAAEGIYP